jgi:outer membrane protein assembly factor BamB
VTATAAAVLLAALLPGAGLAERTRYWKQSSFEDFEKGTASGVALRSDGRLVLAPRFAQFADPNLAYVWCLRVDSKGVLYAAGGSNARVVRFDEKGSAKTVFESSELAAQALALDSKDNLFVGTSPDGKVYRVTPQGQQSVFFEPKTKYIWDIVVDASGAVFVATGDKGEVYAVSPDGKGQVYYTSPETHIRSLALDSKGNLIVGTEPNGLVVRVNREAPARPDQGRSGFVLLEMNRKEVTSLLPLPSGELYAAAVGEKPRATMPGAQTIVPQTVVTGQPGVTVSAPGVIGQTQVTPFVPFPSLTGGGEVYRFAADGAPEEVWTSRDDLVYSLGFDGKGKLLLGTGNRGLVVQLEENRQYLTLPKTAAGQVTSLAAGPGGRIFVGTANPGKVFVLGPDAEPEGTFESQTFDAKVFSQWGMLTWWGEDGATSGRVSFYVRTGNTSKPEKNWSEWCGPYTQARGEVIACPAARFVQWKAVFKNAAEATPGALPASISWVNLAYLPKNIAPMVESIAVQNPGIRVQGFAAPQQQQQQPAQLRLPQARTGVPGAAPQPPQQPQRFEAPPQGFAQRGYQSVLWSARDANDDDLLFTIYYRGEGETAWKLLKDKIEQKFFTFESSTLPDGAYYLKIVASDEQSNPPGEGLTGERVSERFEIDGTPPVVEGLRVEAGNPEVRARFTARDSFSAVARVEYSVDAGEWMTAFPVDRLTDSPQESYELTLKGLAPGEHTFTVRVYDQYENQVTAKATFSLAGGRAPSRRP